MTHPLTDSVVQKPQWRYRCLLAAVSPLIMVYTLWRSCKDGGARYLKERLGIYRPAQPNNNSNHPQGLIWVHAASVGEVFTVLPLLRKVTTPLLVTTMSPTGAAVLQKQALTHVQHCYLPIDFPGACGRFFRQHVIAEGWIVETEIWPWLYACAKSHGVQLTIVNARLSDKTRSQADGWLSATFRQALQNVTVLARSEDDAEGFIALGTLPASCTTVGNLKYANGHDPVAVSSTQPLISKAYVLAASTHADEELQLAQAWARQVPTLTAEVQLVIVPRHPERGAAIQKQLAVQGIPAKLRSSASGSETPHSVLIADTLGELQTWYAFALACFVGGSLIERGGHNVLEAARAGCPIAVGPHTSNFQDIVSIMSRANALRVTADATEVVSFFQQVIESPNEVREMRERASYEANRQTHILDDYLQLLLPLAN